MIQSFSIRIIFSSPSSSIAPNFMTSASINHISFCILTIPYASLHEYIIDSSPAPSVHHQIPLHHIYSLFPNKYVSNTLLRNEYRVTMDSGNWNRSSGLAFAKGVDVWVSVIGSLCARVSMYVCEWVDGCRAGWIYICMCVYVGMSVSVSLSIWMGVCLCVYLCLSVNAYVRNCLRERRDMLGGFASFSKEHCRGPSTQLHDPLRITPLRLIHKSLSSGLLHFLYLGWAIFSHAHPANLFIICDSPQRSTS